MHPTSRRDFLKQTVLFSSAAIATGRAGKPQAVVTGKPRATIQLGLVTYLWAKDWDLSTLIERCEKSGILIVDLRTTHAHGVEPSLSAEERREVKKRFQDSPVKLFGLGSNQQFDYPDRSELRKAVETVKAFVKLSHDVGGSGVRVKPNDLPKGVAPEKTIEQIGKTVNLVAAYASDYGQQIRLECHGQCAPPPIMKQIIDYADRSNAVLLWNSNPQDLQGQGLKYNFNLLKSRLGPALHVRPLDSRDYPFQELIKLLVETDYVGWACLEASGTPSDPIRALIDQRELLAGMIAKAQVERLG